MRRIIPIVNKSTKLQRFPLNIRLKDEWLWIDRHQRHSTTYYLNDCTSSTLFEQHKLLCKLCQLGSRTCAYKCSYYRVRSYLHKYCSRTFLQDRNFVIDFVEFFISMLLQSGYNQNNFWEPYTNQHTATQRSPIITKYLRILTAL